MISTSGPDILVTDRASICSCTPKDNQGYLWDASRSRSGIDTREKGMAHAMLPSSWAHIFVYLVKVMTFG